jgi:hypothetical protein
VEVVEMCNYSDGVAEATAKKAIEQGIEFVKIQGAVETYKEFGILIFDTIAKIAAKCNLSEANAKEQMGKYLN